jgi:hypothetical protein
MTAMAERFPCPCCGHPTLDEEPPGTFDICKECGWEDDNVQFHNPDLRGGANAESLNEARDNYAKYGSHAAPPVADTAHAVRGAPCPRRRVAVRFRNEA